MEKVNISGTSTYSLLLEIQYIWQNDETLGNFTNTIANNLTQRQLQTLKVQFRGIIFSHKKCNTISFTKGTFITELLHWIAYVAQML